MGKAPTTKLTEKSSPVGPLPFTTPSVVSSRLLAGTTRGMREATPFGEVSKRFAHIFPLRQKYEQVGQVFVVGSGDCGQLGLGPDVLEKERPGKLEYFDDKNIVAVFAGGMHNIALSNDGRLYSWGCNDQLALGRDGEETLPLPVKGLEHEIIVDVACGDSISTALTREGKVYAWGTFRNSTGVFGYNAQVITQATPLWLVDLKHVVSIACGSNHCVAITAEGKAYSWGVGEQGQLGRKIIERHVYESSLKPRAINFRPYKSFSSKFVKAYCGSYHTFLVHESNHVFAFGLNNYGQLGVGERQRESEFEPEQVELLKAEDGIIEIAGGEHHSMFLNGLGQVHVAGRGDSGQLGIPGTEKRYVPTKLSKLSQVKQISCGSAFSLAVTTSETDNLWMWGYGEMGQLANNAEDADQPENTNLKGRTVYCAAAGGQHTVLLLNPKFRN